MTIEHLAAQVAELQRMVKELADRPNGQPELAAPAVDPDLIEANAFAAPIDWHFRDIARDAYLAALRSRPKRLLTEDDVRGVLCEGWSYSTIADHLNTILEGPAS